MNNLFGLLIINMADILAILTFFTLWFSYSKFADNSKQDNLLKVMHSHRINWLNQSIRRDERLVDVRIISSLTQSATFFASTSIIIIGSLIALVGYGENASVILKSLPLATEISSVTWFTKTIVLSVIFIYSFFKFTWVIRLFNYSIIMIASAPLLTEDSNDEEINEARKYVTNIARMVSNSASHFNKGMRSYYFGLILISWYLNPILLVLLSVLVVIILYRREFNSNALKILDN